MNTFQTPNSSLQTQPDTVGKSPEPSLPGWFHWLGMVRAYAAQLFGGLGLGAPKETNHGVSTLRGQTKKKWEKNSFDHAQGRNFTH